MFKKILLPLDGSAMSERAIEPRRRWRRGGAEVLLLKVVPSPWERRRKPDRRRVQGVHRNVTRSKVYLEKIARGSRKIREVTILILPGAVRRDPRGRHKEDVDCIVMSTHGGTALARRCSGAPPKRWCTPPSGRSC